jgi:hypothetical protein
VGGFFKCFYWPWFSTQVCWEDSVLLWVGVERRSVGKLTGFLRKGSSRNCIIVKIVFFSFLLQILRENRTDIFLFFLTMRISSVPDFCKSFALGQFWIKLWLPLQVYFPFPICGKTFLYSILIFSTFWSVVTIKCHAVFLYRITIYSLMSVTVMILLCVNTVATATSVV